MSPDIAHRLVAWPVADRRQLLAEVDRLRDWQRRAVEAMLVRVRECCAIPDGEPGCDYCHDLRALIEEATNEA